MTFAAYAAEKMLTHLCPKLLKMAKVRGVHQFLYSKLGAPASLLANITLCLKR